MKIKLPTSLSRGKIHFGTKNALIVGKVSYAAVVQILISGITTKFQEYV